MFATLIAALAVQAAPATPAARAAPVCPAPTTVAAPFGAWRDAHPPAHGFVIGRAIDLSTMPVANIRLAVQPSRPLSGSHVATGSFDVITAGRYSVAVGGATQPIKRVWLDIAGADNKPLTSVAHGHGQACTGMTKVVEFDLKPGRYTLLATGLTAATPVRALIVPKR